MFLKDYNLMPTSAKINFHKNLLNNYQRLRSNRTLIYFFQMSAALSGLLFGVNPFNQPGVEVYKKEIKETLGEL